MLHVFFISPHSDPEASLGELDSGGQCVYEHQLATSLSKFPDFKITTFCRQTFRRPDLSTINNSYSIQRIHCGKKDIIPKEEIEAVIPEFSRQVLAKAQACTQAGDTVILHAHYWDGGRAALEIKNSAPQKYPLVWTPHSLGSTKRSKFPGTENEVFYNFIPRQLWESYTCISADAIVVSTDKEKQSLLEDYNLDESKISIISPGVNFQDLYHVDRDIAKKKLGLPNDGVVLLCMGRMVKTKGYHYAINVLEVLQKRSTQKIYLAIVGGAKNNSSAEEQKYAQELRQQVKKKGLTKSVFFIPAVEHARINEVFSAVDIFLMSSEHEPFGIVTIEAMAMKVPVVAANSGGNINILSQNETGILVDFHQPERVASSTLPLLKDTYFYLKISENSFRVAKKEFDWYQKTSCFAQIYRQVSRFNPKDNFRELVQQKYFLQRYFK